MDIKIGDKDIGFVFQGDELIYPNYIKDGLVLHYDFSGMENNDVTRGVARDLSDNGNDGVLENFAYDEGSGYVDNGLEFDGVDDYVELSANAGLEYTMHFCVSCNNIDAEPIFTGSNQSEIYLRFRSNGAITFSHIDSVGQKQLFTPTGMYKSGSLISLTAVADSSRMLIFINGEQVAVRGGITGFAGNNILTAIGSWRRGGYTPLDGDIKSSLIYNRALSTEEIAHNYKIDKHRFNIQD